MRVRKIIAQPKLLDQGTGKWSDKDLPPRWCPTNAKSKPMRVGWQWRAAKVSGASGLFILVAECNPLRGNWKSILIAETSAGHSVVARFEHHESHPGTHIHSHCDRSGVEVGPSGMDGLARIPPASARHRRSNTWTPDGFWQASLTFFRIGNGSKAPDADDLFGAL